MDLERGLVDGGEVGGGAKIGDLSGPAEAQRSSFVGGIGVELERGIPERLQHLHAVVEVPDTGTDHAARADDTAKLVCRRRRVGGEIEDELGCGKVKDGIVEGDGLGTPGPYIDAGMPMGAGFDEARRGIARGDGIGPESSDEFCGERPRPASEIERAHPGRGTHQRCERGREGPGAAAHERVLGIAGRVERACTLGWLHRSTSVVVSAKLLSSGPRVSTAARWVRPRSRPAGMPSRSGRSRRRNWHPPFGATRLVQPGPGCSTRVRRSR